MRAYLLCPLSCPFCSALLASPLLLLSLHDLAALGLLVVFHPLHQFRV